MILAARDPAADVAGDEVIDLDDVALQALATSLRQQAPADGDFARAAFDWVRDEVAHSLDALARLSVVRDRPGR